MANYKLTNKAVEDLEKIRNYSFEKFSEQQADKYYAL
ncbi:MAG: type II toxin-antitoxin system RelE/ParE family toxin [Ferruginibacter sp.]